MSVTSDQPLVHIVLLNWNNWHDTMPCLESLTHLTYPNFRVLVIDNGSSTGPPAAFHNLALPVTLIENGRNLGFTGGNNVGMRVALQEGAAYVWLLNNDTTVDPKSLTELVAVAEADPGVGAVGSVLIYMAPPQQVQAWGGGGVNLWTGAPWQWKRPIPAGGRLEYIVGASMLLRRQALEQVGLLDEGCLIYWDDTDLSWRLRQAGWKLAVAPGSRVWHKESASYRGKGCLHDAIYFAAMMRFLARYAPLPPVPMFWRVSAAVAKRVVLGDFPRAAAVLRGALRPNQFAVNR